MNQEYSTPEKEWKQNGQEEPSRFFRLYDHAEQYLKTSVELYRLKAVKTGAGIFSSVATGFILGVVFSMVLLFASIGLALYLGKLLGAWHHGFFAVCGIYLIAGIVVYAIRTKILRRKLNDYFVKEVFED